MEKIIGLGNALVDMLVPLENDNLLQEMHFPKGSMQLIDGAGLAEINRRVAGMRVHRATGGSAGNTILALANLDAAPGFIGKIGRDEAGIFFRHNCREHGIEAHLPECDLPTGVASTFISTDGERTFGTCLGAAATMKAGDLKGEMLDGYAYLYVEGYLVQDHEMIERAMALGKEAGLKICLDLAGYNIVAADLSFITYLVEHYVDILFANEEESLAFTGEEPERALDCIAGMCSIAVVKVGSKGAWAERGAERVFVEPVRVERVIDTTGAGDYFAAGFMYGVTAGMTLKQCGKTGALLASHVIQVIGTTLPAESWNEIKLNINAILSE